ncbi:hypothetical protein RB195_001522 [Necator americanus]
MDQLTDQDLRAHLFDSTVLPALCYAAETWADTAATSRKLLTTQRALERCLLKFNRLTQHIAGLRGSELRGSVISVTDPRNYRGISLLRVMYKVLERIIQEFVEFELEKATWPKMENLD